MYVWKMPCADGTMLFPRPGDCRHCLSRRESLAIQNTTDHTTSCRINMNRITIICGAIAETFNPQGQ